MLFWYKYLNCHILLDYFFLSHENYTNNSISLLRSVNKHIPVNDKYYALLFPY